MSLLFAGGESSLNKTLVLELPRSEYVARREKHYRCRQQRHRKTHVALRLELAAYQKGLAVGFTTPRPGSTSCTRR